MCSLVCRLSLWLVGFAITSPENCAPAAGLSSAFDSLLVQGYLPLQHEPKVVEALRQAAGAITDLYEEYGRAKPDEEVRGSHESKPHVLASGDLVGPRQESQIQGDEAGQKVQFRNRPGLTTNFLGGEWLGGVARPSTREIGLSQKWTSSQILLLLFVFRTYMFYISLLTNMLRSRRQRE